MNDDHMVDLNVLAALYVCMGLKYASSADVSAKKCITHYLDQFIRLAELRAIMIKW
jgi:hypothetical protein